MMANLHKPIVRGRTSFKRGVCEISLRVIPFPVYGRVMSVSRVL